MNDPTGDIGIDRFTAFVTLFGFPIALLVAVLLVVLWIKIRERK